MSEKFYNRVMIVATVFMILGGIVFFGSIAINIIERAGYLIQSTE